MEEKWITIYTYYDIFEVQELEFILKENHIPIKIISREDTAFDGIFKSEIGQGVFQVREDFVDTAKKIIEQYTTEKQKQPKETEPERIAAKKERMKYYKEKYKNQYLTLNTIAIIVLIAIVALVIWNIIMS